MLGLFTRIYILRSIVTLLRENKTFIVVFVCNFRTYINHSRWNRYSRVVSTMCVRKPRYLMDILNLFDLVITRL